MISHRDKWNRRWQAWDDRAVCADSWLLQQIHLLTAGRALDLACGRGRNALELARRGFSVTVVDFSEVALALLTASATAEKLEIDCLRCDLEAQLPVLADSFDLALCFYYLHRPLLPWLLTAVRPGGLLVLRTFSSAGRFSPGELDTRFVLRPGELMSVFADWEVLRHEEGLEASRRGGSLAGIVARRPL